MSEAFLKTNIKTEPARTLQGHFHRLESKQQMPFQLVIRSAPKKKKKQQKHRTLYFFRF